MKLSARKEKNSVLRIQSHLNPGFLVALNLLHIIFLNFAEGSSNHFPAIKMGGGGGSPSLFLRYEQLNPKYKVFCRAFPLPR